MKVFRVTHAVFAVNAPLTIDNATFVVHESVAVDHLAAIGSVNRALSLAYQAGTGGSYVAMESECAGEAKGEVDTHIWTTLDQLEADIAIWNH